jgi:tripartite-type tricarboxylate transporter receptor subunit TctC
VILSANVIGCGASLPEMTLAVLQRRQLLQFAAGAATLPTFLRGAWAQAYPLRPVRVIVGFPPGGTNDIHARLIAAWLNNQSGVPFIVENRPGGTGNLATEAVVRSTPDGYTLHLCGSTELRNEILYRDLKFSFSSDTAPVASLALAPLVIVVHPGFAARSVPELIALAKANPGAITIASPGVGSSAHVSWELFKSMTKISMLHIPYRGGAMALSDLLGQQVQVYFSTIADAMEHIKLGRLNALGVSSASRVPALRDVPAIGEFVPGYEAVGWLGVVAPKETPGPIVNALNVMINRGLANPQVRRTILDWGETVFVGSPAEFGRFITAEKEKWGKVIRAANIAL